MLGQGCIVPIGWNSSKRLPLSNSICAKPVKPYIQGVGWTKQYATTTSRHASVYIEKLLHLCPGKVGVPEQPHTQDSASTCTSVSLLSLLASAKGPINVLARPTA